MRRINTPTLLFALCLGLVTLGVVSVYSASGLSRQFHRQLIFATLGLAAMLIAYGVPYRWFRKFGPVIMLSALVLCVLVFVPGFGVAIKGARRWIHLGPIRLQPSEIAKLALVIYMARMLAERRNELSSFLSGVLPAMLITGLFAVLIVIEPDFGAAFVLCVIIFGMWLAGEVRWFHLLGLAVWTVPAGMIAFISQPYRMRRLLAFIQRDPQTLRGAGYQLHQSLIAIGSGGLWGCGLGESQQRTFFGAEAHTDFIFAIMAEELGFVRMTALVAAYALMVFLGWRVALRATDRFASLLAAGVTLMIFVGAAIHMGVTLGMLPTKGLVLPFISGGGTSLVVSMAGVGLLMNIACNVYLHEDA